MIPSQLPDNVFRNYCASLFGQISEADLRALFYMSHINISVRQNLKFQTLIGNCFFVHSNAFGVYAAAFETAALLTRSFFPYANNGGWFPTVLQVGFFTQMCITGETARLARTRNPPV